MERYRIEYKHICGCCGKEFKSVKASGVIYCSKQCRSRERYLKSKMQKKDETQKIQVEHEKNEYKHICVICGKEFKSVRATGVIYCSKQCRFKSRYLKDKTQDQIEHENAYTHICVICGKKFESCRATSVKYCSPACKRKAYYARKESAGRTKTEIISCPQCGKKFMQTTVNQLYCSDECRNDARRIKAAVTRRINQERKKLAKIEKIQRQERQKNALVRKELAARKMGLTYGKYCLWLEQHPEESEAI